MNRSACRMRPLRGPCMPVSRLAVFTAACILSVHQGLSGQPSVLYNHPELEWHTAESAHFYVHFHEGTERTARAALETAERVYGPLTALYGYEPDGRFHLIIRDHEDDSNGGAYYYDNKVEIWCSAMDFSLRGTHAWVDNVVTHELAHMFSLGAARKAPRQLPAVYFQYLGYEREKRPDVIHGYPNRIVSYPVLGTVVPMWFAEGMAQFHRRGFGYDAWDTHRDMLLRTAALDGSLLPLSAMSVFGKNSIGNERVYNQGLALTSWIAFRYGEDRLGELARAMRKPLAFDFSSASKKVIGRGAEDLAGEWKSWLSAGYTAGLEAVRAGRVEGRLAEAEGSGNFTPAWSPDGSRLAYISSRSRDYLSQTSLVMLEKNASKPRTLAAGAAAGISWSPDGQRIAFSRKTADRSGSHYFDCYTVDIRTKKEKRITRRLRFRQPAWSPDGMRIAGVVEKDGTSNLLLVSSDGKHARSVTSFSNGEQIFDPRWLAGEIVFSMASPRSGRDIAAADTAYGKLRTLIDSSADERDPNPSPDGRFLYYASDRTGIFNLYRLNLESGLSEPVSNVTGGAFSPAAAPDGRIAYALFRSDGFKIAVLDSVRAVEDRAMRYTSPYDSIRTFMAGPFDFPDPVETAGVPAFSPKPYDLAFSKLSFYPVLRMDYPGLLKIGAYTFGSDFLDRVSVSGFFAANGRFDTDASLTFQYRRFFPTLFVEGYRVGLHEPKDDADYRFALLQADVGADWPLGGHTGLRTAVQISRYDAAMEFMAGSVKAKIPYTYHKGGVLQIRLEHEAPVRAVQDIAPVRGRRLTVEAAAASNRFMTGFNANSNYGFLTEAYRKYDYIQFLADWSETVPLPARDCGLGLRVQAGAIDRPVDSFYNLFGGGLDGMRGYSFYSIEGRKLLRLGLRASFPILPRLNTSAAWLHFRGLYGAVYADAGDAWSGGSPEWKRDAGAQLRLGAFSFYGLPTAFFCDAAYGFDRIRLPGGHEEGRAWRWYFGVLFDFME
ncbi:PD40 domain-containing protein [bacterium]|nr:PD40 domain-containing protein [bacterium]